MSSTVGNIRDKIKRRFSHKNEPEPTNFDDYDSNDEQDEETSTYLTKESEKAEAEGHDSGKPGSLLNRMIEHGNKKTEAQLARESQLAQQGNTGAGNTGVVGGGQQQQTVIR
ncbi:uncharacterized protein AB675_10927 [Cyphellophora attinorum]|uniref:Uncharacterized protein n=1 Tax=Cyphellophora attinorum TaxID=1664694 RepID=A0A0N1NXM1_9EURO|nr:uncharacterized protein AB675_10927 [Phialophora attinorum]KPI35480.1 hypothetical protein AB675_10927 [Phialophora attinorum]